MSLDPVLLSRLQFAWVIAWHILLPAFTIGLSWFIAVVEWRYWRSGDPALYVPGSLHSGILGRPAQKSAEPH